APDLWVEININNSNSNKFRIGVMGRDYIHKNLNSIIYVKKIIKEYYKIDIEFYVTLNEKEFSSKSKFFKAEVINLGPLKINECADFYKKMDLIFFPSLLETFSATIIETLFFKKPLICCNLEFNKAVCLDYAIYFEPDNNFDAAQKIYETIQNIKNPIFISKLEEGSNYIINNYSSNRRTNNYLNILNDHIHDK
ncbi:glycosyltransferase, partial [Flavobacteriaceae bacterium]|nr:glycosyltransferase [Flavobacteriaceae bacterium]